MSAAPSALTCTCSQFLLLHLVLMRPLPLLLFFKRSWKTAFTCLLHWSDQKDHTITSSHMLSPVCDRCILHVTLMPDGPSIIPRHPESLVLQTITSYCKIKVKKEDVMRRSNDLQLNTSLQSTSGVCVDVCVANSGKREIRFGFIRTEWEWDLWNRTMRAKQKRNKKSTYAKVESTDYTTGSCWFLIMEDSLKDIFFQETHKIMFSAVLG